ncbi:MAG TPA: hypothetical protein VLE95_01665 [Chlamydiales bacterium]|nr:hypothetical protein [Chlamydiales bacterium]
MVRKSLFAFIGSGAVCLVLSLGGYYAFLKYHGKKILDEKYYIRTIVQTGPEKEALHTSYLAELLNLSIDHPVSLYAFDVKESEKKLMVSPLIKSAKVKRIFPSAIYIDYEARKPVAMLADYKNTAIDRDGYLFPFSPFFSPKEIPELYIGLPSFEASEDAMGRKGGQWLAPLKNPFITLAFDVLRFLDGTPWRENFQLKKIDVSNAFAPSLGQREIVLFTEEKLVIRKMDEEVFCVLPKILRVAPKDFAQQLNHFFILRRNMEEDYRKQLESIAVSTRFASRIIDLRIPHLAFVQTKEVY